VAGFVAVVGAALAARPANSCECTAPSLALELVEGGDTADTAAAWDFHGAISEHPSGGYHVWIYEWGSFTLGAE
jgi:hypothetical protein